MIYDCLVLFSAGSKQMQMSSGWACSVVKHQTYFRYNVHSDTDLPPPGLNINHPYHASGKQHANPCLINLFDNDIAIAKAYCWYNNDISNKDTYGALCTYAAAT